MKDVLAIIGVGAIATIVFGILYCMISDAVVAIKRRKREYELRHRFDKPPMAKCFCHDCVWHSSSTLWCLHFKIRTTDDTFCNWATPTCKEKAEE